MSERCRQPERYAYIDVRPLPPGQTVARTTLRRCLTAAAVASRGGRVTPPATVDLAVEHCPE